MQLGVWCHPASRLRMKPGVQIPSPPPTIAVVDDLVPYQHLNRVAGPELPPNVTSATVGWQRDHRVSSLLGGCRRGSMVLSNVGLRPVHCQPGTLPLVRFGSTQRSAQPGPVSSIHSARRLYHRHHPVGQLAGNVSFRLRTEPRVQPPAKGMRVPPWPAHHVSMKAPRVSIQARKASR